MIEIQEREEQALVEEKVSAERAAHNVLMTEANLDGVETLGDDLVCVCVCVCVCVHAHGGWRGVRVRAHACAWGMAWCVCDRACACVRLCVHFCC